MFYHIIMINLRRKCIRMIVCLKHLRNRKSLVKSKNVHNRRSQRILKTNEESEEFDERTNELENVQTQKNR